MKFRDYDPENPPYIPFPTDEKSLYPILEAFAPNLQHDEFYKLNAIYQWSENLMVNAKKLAVCDSGCHYCCSQRVAVKPIEVRNIKANIATFRPKNNGTFCPLLDVDNVKCGAYEYRPLICRAMLSLDHPKYCQSNEPHYTFDFIKLGKNMHETLIKNGELGKFLGEKIENLMSGEETDLSDIFL